MESVTSTSSDRVDTLSSASSVSERTPRQALQLSLAGGNVRVVDAIKREWVRGNPTTIVAIDVEASCCGKPVEIGITTVDLMARVVSSMNIRVEEHLHLPMIYELAEPAPFAHGLTEVLPLHTASIRINALLDNVLAGTAGCVVGHALQNDVRWLTHLGIDLAYLPQSDTSTLGMLLTDSHMAQSLERACVARGFDFLGKPHCAGDDAYMTAKLWVAMVHEYTGCKLIEF